jgi:hypothetical protein
MVRSGPEVLFEARICYDLAQMFVKNIARRVGRRRRALNTGGIQKINKGV